MFLNLELSEPIAFIEVTGEHDISERLRGAIVYAAIEKFLTSPEYDDLRADIDFSVFTEEEKELAKAVVLRGPMTDENILTTSAKLHKGIIVVPTFLWVEDETPFAYVAVLTH